MLHDTNRLSIALVQVHHVLYNKLLFDLLGEYCNKPSQEVMEFASRDKWLDPTEALEYGIIDEVIEKVEK